MFFEDVCRWKLYEVGLDLNKYSKSKKISIHEEWTSNPPANKEGSLHWGRSNSRVSLEKFLLSKIMICLTKVV